MKRLFGLSMLSIALLGMIGCGDDSTGLNPIQSDTGVIDRPANQTPVLGRSLSGSIASISFERKGIVLRSTDTVIGSILVGPVGPGGTVRPLAVTDNTIISVQDGQNAVRGNYGSLKVGQRVAVRFIEIGDLDVAPGFEFDLAVEITVFK